MTDLPARTVAHAVEPPAAPPPSPAAPAPAPAGPGHDSLRDVLRPVLGFLANVTVLTALLVYFGWRRSETQAERLGIDESILGMSTRDYLLRSVGPVLVLLVGIGVAGLAWLALDQRLTPLMQAPGRARRATRTVRLLGWAWLVLPAAAYLAGYVWPAQAFVLFPATIGIGILLWLYAAHLRHLQRNGGDRGGHNPVALGFGGLLVAVCLFWTASNYAEVLGVQLADDLAADIGRLPSVTVYSEGRLHLEGPAVDEDRLPDDGTVLYRYGGLRLLEHTGGRFFLVSDGWTPRYGVVFVLRDDDETMRLDFVRDRR